MVTITNMEPVLVSAALITDQNGTTLTQIPPSYFLGSCEYVGDSPEINWASEYVIRKRSGDWVTIHAYWRPVGY